MSNKITKYDMSQDIPVPYVARLMRLRKDTKDITICAEQICNPTHQGYFHHHYTSLWRWIGGEGFVHPHPLLCYWIENAQLPAYPQVAVILRDYVA